MWYQIDNESSVFTPSILVYPERIEENIRKMIAIAGDAQRLRPHVKTHKSPEIIKLQVKYGIRKFKCATLSELEMVASNGGEDILLAYPLLGPALPYYFEILRKHPQIQFSVCVDSFQGVDFLHHYAANNSLKINVFVDIDNGMHRTGISPDNASELIEYINNLRTLSFAGLHIYDGHIRDKYYNDRKNHVLQDFHPVDILIQDLDNKRIIIKELACGGSPTFPIHARYKERTLCPGTTIFWDFSYLETAPEMEFLPAAVIAGRVISKPDGNICFDLGTKAIASEMPQPRLKFLNFENQDVIGQSEEHLVISGKGTIDVEVGNMFYALPRHVCPTIALHDKVYVVENGEVTGTWTVTARNRIY